MLDAETVTYNGDAVIMPHDLYGDLTNYVTDPLLRIGKAHYWPKAEQSVPGGTVAIPDYVEKEEGAPVLLAKDGTTERLMYVGEVEAST